ncbi:flavodoxin domain-containing protein [Gordonia sp. VNQ95]|jgi:menaquinone-dependent protoporphyrinogen oxidase|uniref:flavodoxin domain-containing protein n=1 Tax=Gordonia TaxID=2053 RepID=UPI0032B628E5
MTSSVLVAYASADGSTAEVAERLGEHLSESAMSVSVASVADRPDTSSFDVVVAGSAIHNGDFLPEFAAFVDENEQDLRQRPVWLFSLGMGPTLRGPIGAIFRTKVPPAIAALRDRIDAVEYHPFAGSFGRPPERRFRMVMWAMGARPGDHRDWDDVEKWAATIAAHPVSPTRR